MNFDRTHCTGFNIGIGMIGPQRTGKTTTAGHVAEFFKIPKVEANLYSVFTRLGYTPKEQYDLDTRIKIQSALLEHLSDVLHGGFALKYIEDSAEEMGALQNGFVIDRTPLDLAAYMMADVVRDCTVQQADKIEEFVRRCVSLHKKFFKTTVLFPAIPVGKDLEKSATINAAYMQHINLLCFSLMHQNNIQFIELRTQAEFERVAVILKNTVGDAAYKVHL